MSSCLFQEALLAHCCSVWLCNLNSSYKHDLDSFSFVILLSFFSCLVGPQQARLRQGAMKYLISHNSQGWFHTSKVILYLCSRAGHLELLIFIGISGDMFVWDLLEFKKSSSKCLKWHCLLLNPGCGQQMFVVTALL